MADIGTEFRSHIVANAGVSALVSSRVYPLLMPQGVTYPAVTYQLISDTDEETRTHSDLVGGNRLTMPRLQVDTWSNTYTTTKAVAKAIKDAVVGFVGTMGVLSVRGCWLDSAIDFYDDESETYRVSQDYILWYTEG